MVYTQRAATNIGVSGCYWLSIINASKIDCDIIKFYARCVYNKWINDDCFVNAPDEIMQDLTCKAWNVTKESANYKCRPGEIEILRFERVNTGATLAHFVVGDGLGNVAYDPLGDSGTVKYGTLASKRIFREVK